MDVSIIRRNRAAILLVSIWVQAPQICGQIWVWALVNVQWRFEDPAQTETELCRFASVSINSALAEGMIIIDLDWTLGDNIHLWLL